MGQSVSLCFFLMAIALYAGGALASLAAGRSRTANGIGSWSAVLGSLAGLVALLADWSGPEVVFSCSSQLPLGMLRIAIDSLSRFFLLPVFLLTGLCALYGARYLQAWQGRRNLGAHWFFLNLLAAGMALVPVVDDGFLFLIVWEFMSLTPFFLVAFEDDKADVREASWVYLVAAHLGAFFLLAAFALLSGQADSFSFDAYRMAAPNLPPATAAVIFILALVGFGAKAGFAPLHIWLPEAHPAAPSHVSALMSGAMVNAGIYGLCRTFEFLGPVQSWQGPLLLGIGLATALYGVLAALVQKNLKRLLALSTVENMGIAAIGLGAGLTGLSWHNPKVAFLGFAGALLHVLNHSFFKGLLFLAAGAALKATGTASLNALGGLAKKMPVTAALFAAGAAAISGLPPFNGFVGEFALYLSLTGGFESSGIVLQVAGILCFTGLAAVGGLVLACFARAYGTVFCGEPRSAAVSRLAANSDPGRNMLLPMLALALLCLAGGLCAPVLFSLAVPAVSMLSGSSPELAGTLGEAFSSMTMIAACGLLFALFVLALVLLQKRLSAARPPRLYHTWDCGYVAPDARMQYTGFAFAHPLARIFGPATGLSVKTNAPENYFPDPSALKTAAPDLAREKFLGPLFEKIRQGCDWLKLLQHGRIHLYILYMLVTLVALLLWKLA